MNIKEVTKDEDRGIDDAAIATALGITIAQARDMVSFYGRTSVSFGIARLQELQQKKHVAAPAAYAETVARQHMATAKQRAEKSTTDNLLRQRQIEKRQAEAARDREIAAAREELLDGVPDGERPALIEQALQEVVPFLRDKCRRLGWASPVLRAIIHSILTHPKGLQ